MVDGFLKNLGTTIEWQQDNVAWTHHNGGGGGGAGFPPFFRVDVDLDIVPIFAGHVLDTSSPPTVERFV